MKRALKYLFLFVICVFLYYSVMYFSAWKNGNFGNAFVDGPSMEPTFQNGDKLFVNHYGHPAVGDVVSFQCHAEKCHNGNASDIDFAKRIVKIQDGCYWFQGDNHSNSFDSRRYGWLCGDELHINGVIHKVPSL